MDRAISPSIFAASWLIAALIIMEMGRRVGIRRLARDPAKATAGLGTIEGAVFGLFGLSIAFTFYGSAGRYDVRRQLLAEEVNDIGTAYLRLDMLPPAAQPALRGLFRDYVDSRLEVYREPTDIESAIAKLAPSERIQGEIWTLAAAAAVEPGAQPNANLLLLPALNFMFDITNTRLMAARIHPPLTLYALLFVVGLACSALAGYGMSEEKYRSWLHILGFTVIMSLSLFVILEMEYPRLGLIRLDSYDQVLVELRDKMR